MAYLNVQIGADLKNAVGEAAEKEGLTMNEWVAKSLARVLNRKKLGEIKRRPPGRPRKVAS